MNKHVASAEAEIAAPGGEKPASDFDAVIWGAEKALKSLIEYQIESLRFFARRTSCNLEHMRRLRRCGNPQEIAEVQQSWFKRCLADYGEEVGRLTATGFHLVQSDFAPLQWLMYRQPREGSGDSARR
jgi:hypothetical protein